MRLLTPPHLRGRTTSLGLPRTTPVKIIEVDATNTHPPGRPALALALPHLRTVARRPEKRLFALFSVGRSAASKRALSCCLLLPSSGRAPSTLSRQRNHPKPSAQALSGFRHAASSPEPVCASGFADDCPSFRTPTTCALIDANPQRAKPPCLGQPYRPGGGSPTVARPFCRLHSH